MDKVVIRPGRVYFVIGCTALVCCAGFGIWAFIEKIEMFCAFYLGLLMPMFICVSFINMVFYYRKKIILTDKYFTVKPVCGKSGKWSYNQITQIDICESVGISRPITIKYNHKKIVKVVTAYYNYDVLDRILMDKCRDKIQYL